MLTDVNLKALFAGTLAYLVSVMLVSGLLTLIANSAPQIFDSSIFRTAYWIIGVLMLSVGGLLSGYMAASRGVLHGVVVAIAGAVAATIFLSMLMPGAVDQGTFMGYLGAGVILSGLAGGNGELLARKFRDGRS